MGYLDEWEKSVNARQGFTDAEKAMMLLSRETIEGLQMTGMNYLHNMLFNTNSIKVPI